MEKLNLCYGCMNEKQTNEDGTCAICGYNENTPYLPSYLAPGTVLNERYIVGKLKSYNGESASYIGYDTIVQEKVLIKEYMPDTLCSRDKGSSEIVVNQKYMAQYKTFMSEFVELNKVLSKMRTLNHIIAAKDMFGANNTGYVVFGWFDGITLGEYLKNNAGELSWEEVKKMFPLIFTTLSLVHNAGLVHRGISPETILVGENGDIKLTGFCISDERTANTELASEIFNGYAAPEQYNSSNWQGTWTDVYGICALLYRVLTGVVPTDAMSRVANDNLLEPAKLNSAIPNNVSKVIMNGLNLNGDMRIQTITELVTQLFEQPEYNSVRLSSSSTQTISVPKKSGNNAKKNKRPSRHGLFIVVMAVILCVGMFFLLIVLLSMETMENSGGEPAGSVNQITQSAETELPYSDGGIDETVEAPAEMTMVTTIAKQDPAISTSSQTIYVMNDITGKNFDLIQKSSNYGSLVFNPVYEYNNEIAKGVIFEQSIAKNESYENGAEITVKVSMGPKLVTVPEFLSMSKKDYFALLNEVGIKYEESETVTAEVKEGYVYGTSKQPGEMIDVEKGEILTVFIAKAPETTATEAEPPKTDNPRETEADEQTAPITAEPEVQITFYD